jgi:hypothetical protein
MPVIINPVTAYQPRYPVVDVHSHAFKRPERLVGMAQLYAPPNLVFPLYGHGALEEAQATMAMTGIRRRVIKNLTSKPGGVPAANDFALSIARTYPELIPTGTVHPGHSNNEVGRAPKKYQDKKIMRFREDLRG